MTLKEFAIGKNDAGQRLDRFLTKQGLTIGVIRKALRNKDIKVNGKRGQADSKLENGDVVKVYLVLEDGGSAGRAENPKRKFHGVSTELNIVYEDENILLLDKPPGLLCHEGGRENRSFSLTGRDCLINRIKAYLYKDGEWNPEDENSFEPSLCNRIDRNTGGIVIAAKNAETLRVMNEKIRSRRITKLYLCILANVPKERSATLTAFLEKDEQTNTVKVTARKTDFNKTIVTQYRVLDIRGGLALAEVGLLTGRTHQIRAHMAYIGCPLLGDGKYGRNAVNKKYGLDKQALYSYKLIFAPPEPVSEPEEKNHLDYLQGRSFEVENVWFKKLFA